MLNVKKTLTKIIHDGSTKNSTSTILKGTAAENWCRKKIGLVEFCVGINGITWTDGAWNGIARLPDGYRPTSPYDAVGIDYDRDVTVHAKVGSDGYINIFKPSGLSMSDKIRVHNSHFV